MTGERQEKVSCSRCQQTSIDKISWRIDCATLVYHLLRCHPGKFCIFLVLLIIAKKICRDGVSDCQESCCTHEEAHTPMILHAIHADKTFGESGIKGRIIVKSHISKVFWTVFKYFKNGSFADPEQG
jgi:hypothetical protein